MKLMEVVEAYEAKFGDKPHILRMSNDEAISLMLEAIKTGVPIPDPDVPEGALI